jgi:thiol-disulfide isomerase/thioredoxin
MVQRKKSVDVRSKKDIPEFEKLISTGPITIVLVYADWCGHCTTYKKNVWNNLLNMKGRNVNLASVHHDQLVNTSQAEAKINGYPSVLIIGNDKKAAKFNDGTNALPNANDMEAMEKMVKSPEAIAVEEEAPVILNNVQEPVYTAETAKIRNAINESLAAPNVREDVLQETAKPLRGGGSKKEGTLLSALGRMTDFLRKTRSTRKNKTRSKKQRKQTRKQRTA